MGVVCVILSVAVLIQYRLVTDRQMDGQTDGLTTTANTLLALRRTVKTKHTFLAVFVAPSSQEPIHGSFLKKTCLELA